MNDPRYVEKGNPNKLEISVSVENQPLEWHMDDGDEDLTYSVITFPCPVCGEEVEHSEVEFNNDMYYGKGEEFECNKCNQQFKIDSKYIDELWCDTYEKVIIDTWKEKENE